MANNRYRLLALDLDGTLLNEHDEISPANREWVRLASESGIVVCVSTGREFSTAVPFAELLGLKTPMVTVNGSEVWREPYVLHRRTAMAADRIIRLKKLAERHDTRYWAFTADKAWNNDAWPDDVMECEWLKFDFHLDNTQALQDVWQEIKSWGGLDMTKYSPHNIEVTLEGVSKASGLLEVCRLLDIDMSEVVSVGDGLNDIAAIRASGLGVAMGNALDEVKAVADVFTASNTEDGVALMIQKYVLNA